MEKEFEILHPVLPEKLFEQYPAISWNEPSIKFWHPYGKTIGYHWIVFLRDTETNRLEQISCHMMAQKKEKWVVNDVKFWRLSFESFREIVEWFYNQREA